MHFISKTCEGVWCHMCKDNVMHVPATHKVGEEIAVDAPGSEKLRHNLTAYVCCDCFRKIMGPAVPCPTEAGRRTEFASKVLQGVARKEAELRRDDPEAYQHYLKGLEMIRQTYRDAEADGQKQEG